MFGCDAYAHVPKDERGIFDAKPRKCALLGYGEETKGYRLYDVNGRKVLYSRDVQFNEKSNEKEQDPPDVRDEDYKLVIGIMSNNTDTEVEAEEQQPDTEAQKEGPRRSSREKRQPDCFGREQGHLIGTPITLKDATVSSDNEKWKAAMDSEMRSLQENDVWDLVELPPGRKTVGSKCVFKKKTGADGTVERLKFFNDLNIIKYSDALPDIIFIDSQVPLDKVSELVQRCNYLLYGDEAFPSFNEKWRRFCEEGVITVDLLREFESHYDDGLFECQHLIQLLRHQLAVVPLAEIEPAASIDEQCDAVDYFFPALLKMLQRPDLEKHRVFSCAATPLLFRFSHGCRRSGVFCCLVVHLMKHSNWCIQHENGNLILVARNCITFRPYRNDCYVTLIDAFFYIEVHVEAPPPMCVEHCPTIRKEITNGIVAACKVLKYANDHPQLAFFCPHSGSVEVKGEEDRHAATILDKGGYCSCTQTKHFFELEEKHNIWLKKG